MSAKAEAAVRELPTQLRLRLSPSLLRLTEARAREAGSSLEEYVREALVARIHWDAGAAAREGAHAVPRDGSRRAPRDGAARDAPGSAGPPSG